MESPPPKRIKLSRKGVITINLPNPGTPLTANSVGNALKTDPPAIYVEVQGGEFRFKCDAEALKQSSYFAKYVLAAGLIAVEIVLTVPERIDLDDLRLALSRLHKDIKHRDGSITLELKLAAKVRATSMGRQGCVGKFMIGQSG